MNEMVGWRRDDEIGELDRGGMTWYTHACTNHADIENMQRYLP